jgi:hypothetical protein
MRTFFFSAACAAEEKGRAHDITAAAVRKQEMMRRFM